MNQKLQTFATVNAKLFKKVVLKIESIKYKLLSPFNKPAIKLYEYQLNRRMNKELKDKSVEEKEFITIKYQKAKLRFRKEVHNKQQRNYHLGFGDIDETLKYLHFNKEIHLKGLQKAPTKITLAILAIIGSFIIGAGIINTIAILYLCYQLVALFINLECVNLQDYNIKRITNRLDKIREIEKKKQDREIAKYKQISGTITNLLSQSKDLPTPKTIANAITTKEELEQMKIYLNQISSQRKIKQKRRN